MSWNRLSFRDMLRARSGRVQFPDMAFGLRFAIALLGMLSYVGVLCLQPAVTTVTVAPALSRCWSSRCKPESTRRA